MRKGRSGYLTDNQDSVTLLPKFLVLDENLLICSLTAQVIDLQYPTDPFTNLEFQNPWHDVPKLH